MPQIVDTEKKATAIEICKKLEENNWIRRFKIDKKRCEIYIWENHWEVKSERLIELFEKKGIFAREPCVDRTGYGLILDIGKESELSLEECFGL